VVDPLAPDEFERFPGVGEWHATAKVATAKFVTGSFDRGVEFIEVIGRLAAESNHHPDVDLRYSSVVIRLTTHEIHALSERDVALARHISEAARALDIAVEPAFQDPKDR
jgi:pterin-4a-carbinolamine dehydratase